MREHYRCPDGREVVLRLNKDALLVEARSREGERIGSFQFVLAGDDGEAISLTEGTGETIWLKLAQTELVEAWHDQGITERAVHMASDETGVAPITELPQEM
jgi:hypothetical protein